MDIVTDLMTTEERQSSFFSLTKDKTKPLSHKKCILDKNRKSLSVNGQDPSWFLNS